MTTNGLSDEQYAANRAWLVAKLATYPHASWLVANPEKCWQPYDIPPYCAALAAPGYEVYLFVDIAFRDAHVLKHLANKGLPPSMSACMGLPLQISAGASAPKKVDYSAITREIAGRS